MIPVSFLWSDFFLMDSVDDHGYYFLMESKLTGLSVSVLSLTSKSAMVLKNEEVEVINLALKGLSTFSRETTELVILFLLS